MTTANEMYALSLEQCVNAIVQNGHKRTMLVEGDMGIGKSSMLKMIGDEMPSHTLCYFDCTTKDLGDITIPQLVLGTPEDTEKRGYVQYLTNEELGLHLKKPIALMVDEYGKGNPSVRNALMRTMLERKMGSIEMHPDSVVFATTNLGGEGVGDMFLPHQRNRLTVVRSRKPTNEEWIVNFGINNGIHSSVLSWVKDNPALFQSFTQVANPEDNPYIYHPNDAGRDSFVTPRSLEAASDWLHVMGNMDNQSTTGCLIGTIGARGAMDLMAYVNMLDQLPTLDEIKDSPLTARVPTSAAAVCMVVFRTLTGIDKTWVNEWMDYLLRLSPEAQGMFANGVRAPKYPHQSMVMTNKKFTDWALKNNHMFAADKK